MTDAWVVAWKNKMQRDILEPPNCAHYNQHLPHVLKTLPTGSEVDALDPHPTALVFTDHCLEWSTELFATIIHENTLLAQRGLLTVIKCEYESNIPCSAKQCTCHTVTRYFCFPYCFCFWLAASAANHIRWDWCGGLQYTLLHSHRLLVVGWQCGW